MGVPTSPRFSAQFPESLKVSQSVRTLLTVALSACATLLVQSLNLHACAHVAMSVNHPAPLAMAYSAFTSQSPDNQYEYEYQQTWELVDRFFLYRDRLQDWQGWRHKFDGRLNTSKDLEHALDSMLGSLKDDYTFYRDELATRQREKEDLERNIVSGRMLANGVGYVRIRNFNSRFVVKETRSMLKRLHARAYILDLRDNKGGSIVSAFRTFQLLSPAGVFVRMHGYCEQESSREVMEVSSNQARITCNDTTSVTSREPYLLAGRPLVILVNSKTKSAAEMLAGSLRDHQQGVLVGRQTYGKGVIQRVWQFGNGTSVKITSARYFLPKGATIHGIGLRPNRLLSPSCNNEAQLRLAHNMARQATQLQERNRQAHAAHLSGLPTQARQAAFTDHESDFRVMQQKRYANGK